MKVEMILYVGNEVYTALSFTINAEEMVQALKDNPKRFLTLKKKKLDELADTYQWSYVIVRIDGVLIGGIKAHRAPAVTQVAA